MSSHSTLVGKIVFGAGTDNVIGTGSATVNVELDKLDLSRGELIRMEVVLTAADTDAGDLLNIYLQNRWQSNIWMDRIASHQFLGTLSPSAGSPEVREYTLSKFGDLTDSEEADEPYGSAGASHLTAGTVRNGPFAPRYRNPGVGTETGWRVSLVQVNTSTADAAFAGTVYLYLDQAN